MFTVRVFAVIFTWFVSSLVEKWTHSAYKSASSKGIFKDDTELTKFQNRLSVEVFGLFVFWATSIGWLFTGEFTLFFCENVLFWGVFVPKFANDELLNNTDIIAYTVFFEFVFRWLVYIIKNVAFVLIINVIIGWYLLPMNDFGMRFWCAIVNA